MRSLWFLILLVPLHLVVGALLAFAVEMVTPLDMVARQWVIVPLYILTASALSTWLLSRFVIKPRQKVEFFTVKAMLGAITLSAFLVWAKLMVIYLEIMAPVETDFISAALLVFGTAVMMQFWWTRRPSENS